MHLLPNSCIHADVCSQVIATGTLNFLNLYNSVREPKLKKGLTKQWHIRLLSSLILHVLQALVFRLVLTWFPSVPESISNPLA